MSKATKVWLIVAAFLTLAGLITFAGVMTVLSWDFSKLSTEKYQAVEYNISERFNDVFINANTADVTIVPTDAGNAKAVCHEGQKLKYSVSVQDGTLIVELADSRKWYDHIGININNLKVSLYLPRAEYGSLRIKASTGDVDVADGFKFESVDVGTDTGKIRLSANTVGLVKIKTDTGKIDILGVSADSLDIAVTTGKVNVNDVQCTGDVKLCVSTGKAQIKNVRCRSLSSTGDTGDLTLTDVIASGSFDIKRSTGDVKFNACDADKISIVTDTGDVSGSLLTAKTFITRSDTGDVSTPQGTAGGTCKITTDTGDIRISVN